MKYTSSFIMSLAIIFSFIFLLSCINDQNTSADYLIKVDSIHLPRTVAADTSFEIEFFGTIGFNGCLKFKTFNQDYKNNKFTIGAWATIDDKSGKCPDVLVLLDGQKLKMTIQLPGVYIIIIDEPDNSSLVEQITVY